MQIFVLDSNASVAAKMYADKHVVKQVLETCQLLCATMRVHGIDYGYQITHRNHPCRRWLDESSGNFNWLMSLGIKLSEEYTYRYDKIHKSQSVIEGVYCPDTIPDGELTPFPQAMPDEFKHEDAVQAYRSYYIGAKQRMLTYTRREPPEWLKDIATHKPL